MDYHGQFVTCATINECLEVKSRLMSSGRIAEIKFKIASSTPDDKKSLGQEMNEIRTQITEAADSRIQAIQKEQEQDSFIPFDPTFYSNKYKTRNGKIHPVTEVMKDIMRIFKQKGFDIHDGGHVETQMNNFTMVNMPDYHPARSMQDTFWLKQKDEHGENYVMRTQVTANIYEYAQSHQPPFKTIFAGLAFRDEDIDATHDINFHQFDMWLVDKQVSLAELVTLAEDFFSEFFGKDMKVRLRNSYFPFTLPSFEGDVVCPICDGDGCKTCKQVGWIEVFGAGPIHPNVIRNMGLSTEEWQGIAFGFGLDRLVQLKYKLAGLSQFYNTNLDFLNG